MNPPGPPSYRFEPRVEALADSAVARDLSRALSCLRAQHRPILLDSVSGEPRRFSLLAFDPLPGEPPQELSALRAFCARLERRGGETPPHFEGGFLGALSYDLGVVGEDLELPRDPWELPKIVGGLYVDYLVRDHAEHKTWLVLGEAPGDGRPALAQRRAQVLSALQQEPQSIAPLPMAACERLSDSGAFRRAVESVRERIREGEIYQANLSHRLLCEYAQDPIELYLQLRRHHPGPYLAFLGQADLALLSGSPELLLDFEPARPGERCGRALTRPIKGTLPRGATPEQDRALAAQLLASEKDRAELSMIVDLERNDLGSVALPGGVRVDPFPQLQSFSTVHHLMADVHAELPPERDAVDLLSALFPGGSITGAPKLRSMEVIAELEQEGRGFAYGSILMLDTRGRCLANILIRTLIWRPAAAGGGEVTYRVGGGITYASDAALEEAESLAKGLGLARSLGVPDAVPDAAPEREGGLHGSV